MASNLVDLKLLNTAYGINKKRIDNLSIKIKTETLEVGTTTVTGTAKVTGGNLTTNTLNVTGNMTIDGSVSTSKALTLSNGGTVNGSTTLDSLTGSIKIGSATDASGNATGVASVVVPSGKTLTLDGTATASSLTLGGSATIESSTIKNATLDGGTVNLDSKTLNINGESYGKITGNSNINSATIQNGTVNLKDGSNSYTFTVNKPSNGKINGSTIDSTSTIKNGTIDLKDDSNNSYTFTINAPSNGKINGSTIDSTSTIQNGTVNLNSKTLTINDASNGKITSGTIESATIQNGTINLNSKTLNVTSTSTITTITEGDTTTIEGVGAIDAKSMTLKNTATGTSSLIIENTLGNKTPGDDGTATALYCTGGISAAKVYNAVWNDLADSIEVPQDTELEYGYCYKYKNGKVYKTDEYADPNVLGIHSDTAGMVLGIKPSHIKCINLAVAGVVLAYVDNEYECGTPLVATKEGKLTKANKMTRVLHPERIVATYFRKENNDFWGPSSNKIAVNGRSWVKVK